MLLLFIAESTKRACGTHAELFFPHLLSNLYASAEDKRRCSVQCSQVTNKLDEVENRIVWRRPASVSFWREYVWLWICLSCYELTVHELASATRVFVSGSTDDDDDVAYADGYLFQLVLALDTTRRTGLERVTPSTLHKNSLLCTPGTPPQPEPAMPSTNGTGKCDRGSKLVFLQPISRSFCYCRLWLRGKPPR